MNSKFDKEGSRSKVNFMTRDYYDKSNEISKKTPIWENESENPINYYVSNVENDRAIYSKNISDLRPKTVSLNAKKTTNPAKLFQLTFKKEDCFSTKARLAKKDPITDPYKNSHDHIFRDFSSPLDKHDFCVIDRKSVV